MANDPKKVLDREYGLENLVTPTGRQLGVKKSEHRPGLLEVTYMDDKGGALPHKLNGMYTKTTLAEDDIRSYLREFWDTSDNNKTEKRV